METFQEVWVSLGMGNVHDDEEQLDQIGKYLRHLTSNVPKWRAEKLPESKIVIPSPEVCVFTFHCTTLHIRNIRHNYTPKKYSARDWYSVPNWTDKRRKHWL